MTEKEPDAPTPWTDPDDAPELTEAFFQTADWSEDTTQKREPHPAEPKA